VYSESLHEQYQQQVVKTLPEMTPKAEAILRLAMPIFARGEAVCASDAKPIYIRNRVALTSKEREQGLRL
jgi:tRNA threonylcarbamoyladenosine biosynthesis protein TsaB